MNVVLRVKTDQRSFILKQSRPYVEKYQQIAAPLDRISVENQFYGVLQGTAIAASIPSVLGYDALDHLMLLQDLGQCEDMNFVYKERTIAPELLGQLMTILGSIHSTKVPNNFPDNLTMRRLNHQHIFELPFLENNGFQLDDIQIGLQELSLPYKNNPALDKIVKDIGKRYLSKGDTLLHGDYYPGSWMRKDQNVFVIDPEFGFAGFAEFDLGVMTAHIIMATMNSTDIGFILNGYQGSPDRGLMTQVAGIEIMRRLIGLAQLPLVRSIEEKEYLLRMAYEMIID